MCGRFTVRGPARETASLFGAESVARPYSPSFNVAPGQSVPVVVVREGRRVMDAFRWGLIPSWAKDPAIGNRMINARAETVAEKPAFRQAFLRRRCLVLADGFYEWRLVGKKKQPVHITLKDRETFAFAGLWERWASPEGEEVLSCTLLTTEANEFMRPIHHRMPVILPTTAEEAWLDPENHDKERLLALLTQYPSDHMQAVGVSTFVNSPSHDSSECILPLGEE